MLVTIAGKVHTEIVVEQALEVGVPVYPIPDAGGESKKLLEKYRSRIAAGFDSGALDACLERVSAAMHQRPDMAAAAVVDLIRSARVGKCLVLFPYDDDHDRLYAKLVRPTIERHMIPIRLDRLAQSDPIYASFADAVRASAAIVADITLLNENVMYEIGYAHGLGPHALIYTRDATRLDALPVYFRTLNVRLANDVTPIDSLVDEYLRATRNARRSDRMLV